MYYNIENEIPIILFVISIIILLVIQNTRLLLLYLAGYLINFIANRLLRNIIKDKRLTENGSEKYNMPSGHAQMSLYSTVFIAIILYKKNLITNSIIRGIIILFYLALSYRTCYISVHEKYHTMDQVVVGAIIGAIIGTIIVIGAYSS
jgi:dolichyldiphosphatase